MLNTELSQKAKEAGMEKSRFNAGDVWGREAYGYFVDYCQKHSDSFMAEQAREYAENMGLPSPPSRRAWGSVVARAKRNNIIYHVGYGQVSNPYAHRANASIWISKIFEMDEKSLFDC